MTVLSESVDSANTPDRRPCVLVGTDDDVCPRITAALSDGNLKTLRLPDLEGGRSSPAVDASAIVVLACDINRSKGMAALRRLQRELSEPAIVVVSPSATGTGVRRALDAGAAAVVFEPELESTLPVAIKAVASGQSVVPRNLRASVERPVLSYREQQVLAFVSTGLTNAQIAVRLFLAESTVKSHLSSAFSKLGVRSRNEAAMAFRALDQTADLDAAGAPLVEAAQGPTAAE